MAAVVLGHVNDRCFGAGRSAQPSVVKSLGVGTADTHVFRRAHAHPVGRGVGQTLTNHHRLVGAAGNASSRRLHSPSASPSWSV